MEQKILNAIEIIYDSVGDQFNYESALEAYSSATDNTAIGMTVVNPLTGNIRKLGAFNIPEASFEGWKADAEKCPVRETLRIAVGKVPLGIPILRRTIVSDVDWLNSHLYRRTAQPWGFHGDGYTLLSRNILKAVICAFVRQPDQEEISSNVLASMAVLNKHLARAVSMQQRLSHVEHLLIQSRNILDLIEFGLVLYRADKKLLYVNASAARIFDDDDGVRVESGGIQIRNANIQQKFTALLAETCREDVSLSVRSGGILSVPRVSGRTPYTLTIAPMNDNVMGADEVATVVFIFDPNKQKISVVKALINSYGLTKTEAELATNLMHGLTLDECAKKRGVSYNTVKYHLHSIFTKTSTNRQAELVSLLLHSIVGLNLKS